MLLYLLVKRIFSIIVIVYVQLCTINVFQIVLDLLFKEKEHWNFSQQYTPEIHRDKYNLLKAISVMADVANAINEFKRRKDLGEDVKYCLISTTHEYLYYARKIVQTCSNFLKLNIRNVVSTLSNI